VDGRDKEARRVELNSAIARANDLLVKVGSMRRSRRRRRDEMFTTNITGHITTAAAAAS